MFEGILFQEGQSVCENLKSAVSDINGFEVFPQYTLSPHCLSLLDDLDFCRCSLTVGPYMCTLSVNSWTSKE